MGFSSSFLLLKNSHGLSQGCEVLFFMEHPAHPLGPITMQAAVASECTNVSNYDAYLRAWVSAPHAQLDTASSASTYQTRLQEASDWLPSEQAHGGVRQV